MLCYAMLVADFFFWGVERVETGGYLFYPHIIVYPVRHLAWRTAAGHLRIPIALRVAAAYEGVHG